MLIEYKNCEANGIINVDYPIEGLNKGKIIAKNFALKKQGDTRVHFAQSFCNELICAYWTSTLQKHQLEADQSLLL